MKNKKERRWIEDYNGMKRARVLAIETEMFGMHVGYVVLFIFEFQATMFLQFLFTCTVSGAVDIQRSFVL